MYACRCAFDPLVRCMVPQYARRIVPLILRVTRFSIFFSPLWLGIALCNQFKLSANELAISWDAYLTNQSGEVQKEVNPTVLDRFKLHLQTRSQFQATSPNPKSRVFTKDTIPEFVARLYFSPLLFSSDFQVVIVSLSLSRTPLLSCCCCCFFSLFLAHSSLGNSIALCCFAVHPFSSHLGVLGIHTHTHTHTHPPPPPNCIILVSTRSRTHMYTKKTHTHNNTHTQQYTHTHTHIHTEWKWTQICSQPTEWTYRWQLWRQQAHSLAPQARGHR
jgi:hypothetical protein